MVIKLGKKTHKGRITLDVIMRIETALNIGVVEATRKLSDGTLTLTEMLAILTPVIRAGGNDVTEKDVAKFVESSGYRSAMTEAGNILMAILSDGTDEGNEEEAVEVA
ncbi:MAG: GTA-gp10 family protein [Betaproteobacteria bacterium]